MKGLPMRNPLAELEIPRVFGLSEQPEEINRVMDRYRSSALCGYIHQRKFHLTFIKALEEIAYDSPHHGFDRIMASHCSSCGSVMTPPPICTRCLLYL